MQAAMITGVSRGLGEALAAELLARGWNVVGVGRKSGARLAGSRYRFVELDLADVGKIDATLSAPLNDIRISHPASVVCINNAAVAGPVGVAGRLTAHDIAASFEVNLAAPAAIANLFCRLFADGVEDRRIINVSSGAAQTVLPGSAMYCAAKAGLEMLTRALAAEQGANGVRVITLRPGILDTGMQAFMRSHAEDVLPTAGLFKGFHERRQLVEPNVAAAKIVDKIVLARIEQGRMYSYADL
jgi:NAD(P)-dependent dehydrogenase (short-subunit alcohol dehydrogenase family)